MAKSNRHSGDPSLPEAQDTWISAQSSIGRIVVLQALLDGSWIFSNLLEVGQLNTGFNGWIGEPITGIGQMLTNQTVDMSYSGASWRWDGLLPAKFSPLAITGIMSLLEQTVRDSEVGKLPVRRRGLRERTFESSSFRVVLRSRLLASTSSLYVRTRCKVLDGSDKGKGARTPTPRPGCLLLGGTLPQFEQGQDLAWMPQGRVEAIPQETVPKKVPEVAFPAIAPLEGRTRMPTLPKPRSTIRPLNPPSNGLASSRFR